MVVDKELKIITYSPTDPQVYHLPETTVLKELKFKHETLCGNLYVAFELTGKNDWWEAPADYDAFGLKPDRQMIYDGRIVFLEVDRGTEDYMTEKGIKGKLDRYVSLSRSRPERRFHVCFTTVDQFNLDGSLKRSAETRAQGIFDLIETYNRADQFMVTTQKWATLYPDKAAFKTLANPQGISISDAK